jgi:cephalosporin hydroxylase
MNNLFIEKSLDLNLKSIINISLDAVLKSTYLGIPTLKNPIDFWIYQEILYEIKPTLLIEIGNFCGGSTLALAHIMDNINKDNYKIIAIDIDHSRIFNKVKEHKNIEFITGDALFVINKVKKFINKNSKVLIIEDSSHMYGNTLGILNLYSEFVSINSYFIVEDSIISNGLDFPEDFEGGPFRAIEEFIKENKNFEVDRSKERFLLTWNPKGFLKRIS